MEKVKAFAAVIRHAVTSRARSVEGLPALYAAALEDAGPLEVLRFVHDVRDDFARYARAEGEAAEAYAASTLAAIDVLEAWLIVRSRA